MLKELSTQTPEENQKPGLSQTSSLRLAPTSALSSTDNLSRNLGDHGPMDVRAVQTVLSLNFTNIRNFWIPKSMRVLRVPVEILGHSGNQEHPTQACDLRTTAPS